MEHTPCPLDALPPNLPLHYLRRLAQLSNRWTIDVVYDDTLPDEVCAATQNVSQFRATIALNPRYHFSAKALARAVTHELLELSMWNMWTIFADALASVSDVGQRRHLEAKMRRERDRTIDGRLASMPFWTEYDVPIPKEALEVYELG